MPTLTTQRRIAIFVPPLLVASLALPFVLRQNVWWEWGNPYWMLQRQTAHVTAHGLPTLFLHVPEGAFNPYFVYYAGFTLSVLAYPAAVLGAWPVFVGATVGAMVAGYLGIWWTARNLGLSERLAVLPALGFSTTPYLFRAFYGNGAWAEYVAANAAAVMLGALTALLWRPGGDRRTALAALVLATATIAGTHNLTAMICAAFVPLVAFALLPLTTERTAPARIVGELGRAAVAVALGVGLTAAWLLPNLWFGRSTLIAGPSISDDILKGLDQTLTRTGNLLITWPTLPDPSTGQWLYHRISLAVMAWALAALVLVVAGRRVSPRVRLSAGALVLLGVGIVALIVSPAWWLGLPRLVKTIQFPFRLTSYLEMVVALGVIVALASLARGRPRGALVGLLAVLVGLQLVGATWGVWASKATGTVLAGTFERDLRASREPESFTQLTANQFRVLEHAVYVAKDASAADLRLGDPLTADRGRLSGRTAVGGMEPTPIFWSPLIRVTGGAHLIGHDDNGRAMVRVTAHESDGRWHATVGPDHPWQLVVGRIVSLLSALVLAGLAVVALGRGRHRISPR